MEQASKAYKKHHTLQEGTAFKIILELHNIRNKFTGFLQDEKFSITRLRVGDIQSDFNDILHDKGSRDLEHRIAFGTLSIASFILVWFYTCFYEIGLQSLPMLTIFIITFFISFICLLVQLGIGELWTLARNFQVKPNENLLELTKILKPEVDALSQKSFKLYLWIEMQTPPMDYGEKLSNAFWPVAVGATKDLYVAIIAIVDSMKSIELSEDRHREALSMINNREQVAVHLKNIQVIEEYAFRQLMEEVRNITCRLTILYDLFMKNYEALNVKDKSHLENGYF
uniref:Proteasome activator PA28 C-terminal domain-containing protein n=1 Tax=Acrobeloides nanus TaxID=290746 RepID=A0A914CR00_9BILA